MKFAFNKEILIKHRFWWLLLLVVPFAATALFLLSTSVLAAILEKDKLAKAKDKASIEAAQKQAKTQKDIDAVVKQKEELAGKMNDVWSKAYAVQAPYYTWPEVMDKEFEFTYHPSSKGGEESRSLFAEVVRINTDKKEVPNDPGKNIVSGTILEKVRDYFTLVDSKGHKYKFYSTAGMRIFRAGEKNLLDFVQLIDFKSQQASVFYQKGKYFHDRLTDEERRAFGPAYKEQIYPILAMVQPVDASGRGRVRLGNWDYAPKTLPPPGNTFFHYFTKVWPEQEDCSEDVWIAQENLWIQREIYRTIRDANDSVAKFKVEKKVGKDKAKLPESYECTNPYWKITLKVKDAETLEAKFENRLPRAQKFNFDLKITAAANAEPLVIKPPPNVKPFNPLGYEKTDPSSILSDKQDFEFNLSEDGKKPVVDLTKFEIAAMEQDLNWETAAVRRIDGVYISSVAKGKVAESHRQFPDPLRAYPPRKTQSSGPPAAASTPPGTKDKSTAPNLPPNKGGVPGIPGAGGGLYGNAETTTRFGDQVRERYLANDTTDQFRKLPVAVVLTVEQGQVDRVQAAFNNSSLRFLTSQVMLSHAAGSLRPSTQTKEPGKDPGFRDPLRGKDPMRVPQPGQPQGAASELEANVELVIYGTITLYERFPSRVLPPTDWK